MNPAAVAGAPLGTGNVAFVPTQDPAAAPIHFGDQFLVVSEGLHCHLVSFIVTIRFETNRGCLQPVGLTPRRGSRSHRIITNAFCFRKITAKPRGGFWSEPDIEPVT